MKYLATILAILPLLWPASVPAQSDDSAEAPPLFDVEIVVFRNVKAPKSREFVLPVSSPGRDEQMLDLSSASSLKALREQGYEILPADQLRLLDEVAKLVESSRYDLLLHAGWRQPGLDQQQALPVWIRGGRIYGNEYTSIDDRIEPGGALPYGSAQGEGKEYQFDAQTSEARQQQLEKQLPDRSGGHYELEGKITITLSRYLHAWVDLVMRRPRLTIDEAPDNPIQEEYLATRAADTRILNNHSLRERRRMRSRHLHYLDNPEFAMLILITPYDAAAAAEAARADAADDDSTATE